MASVEIHGHTIDLEPAEDGEHVTDVLVLCRVVRFAPGGKMEDTLTISSTPQTTGMIQRGMLATTTDPDFWVTPE